MNVCTYERNIESLAKGSKIQQRENVTETMRWQLEEIGVTFEDPNDASAVRMRSQPTQQQPER